MCRGHRERIEAFHRFEKVGVGRLVVLVFGVEHAGHVVELGLEVGRAVDRVGGGPGRGQGGLGLGQVVEGQGDFRFEQVDAGEEELVVELLERSQEGRDERQCFLVLRSVIVPDRSQAGYMNWERSRAGKESVRTGR